MGRRLLLSLPLLLAGACQQAQPQADEASVADQHNETAAALAEVSDPNAFKPGKWETKQEIGGVATSDLPADSKAEIRKTSAAIDQCLAPAEARQPDANFFAGGDDGECKYTNFSMHDGRLEASMTCTSTPGVITMALKGNYTPTTYALDATATQSGTGDAPTTTSAKLTGTWLEACPDPAAQRTAESKTP
jgi:hypothetical protein